MSQSHIIEGRVGSYAERLAIDGRDRYQKRVHVDRYRFAARLVRGKSVLDVACGEGYGTDLLMRAGATSALGVDISELAVQHASKKYYALGARYILGNAERLDLTDNSFDVVVSFETIEHLPNYLAYLAEVRRVLRPGGIYLVSTPNRLRESPGRGRNDKPLNPHHVREFTRDELLPILREYFTVDAVYGQQLLHPLFTPVRMIKQWRQVQKLLHTLRVARFPTGHIGTGGVKPWVGRYDNPAYFIAECSKSISENMGQGEHP
jgi:ubiquinone/menaquinone biosynthesis C-methylase UbiE